MLITLQLRRLDIKANFKTLRQLILKRYLNSWKLMTLELHLILLTEVLPMTNFKLSSRTPLLLHLESKNLTFKYKIRIRFRLVWFSLKDTKCKDLFEKLHKTLDQRLKFSIQEPSRLKFHSQITTRLNLVELTMGRTFVKADLY